MKVATDYVVCEVVDKNTDKPYVLEGNQPDQNTRLKVVGVGPQVDACEVGDNIVAKGQQFQAFNLEGKTFLVLQNNEVIAVLDGE